MRPTAIFILLTIMLLNLSCSVNILENFANKTTNEALFVDAKELINQGDYTGALAKIALLTGSFASDRSVVQLKASAYGGICGLQFIPLVLALKNIGTTKLFPFLVNHFKNSTATRMDACRSAEDLVESIGAIGERTSDENMLLVLISFAKIGNTLSYYTDAAQDGTADVGTDVCVKTRASRPASAVAGDFYDSDLREIGSGITLAINNITAVTSTVDLADASLTSISSACTDLATLNAAYDFCSITDPAAFTATHLKGIMSLIKESVDVGLGTNCTGDVSTCNCP